MIQLFTSGDQNLYMVGVGTYDSEAVSTFCCSLTPPLDRFAIIIAAPEKFSSKSFSPDFIPNSWINIQEAKSGDYVQTNTVYLLPGREVLTVRQGRFVPVPYSRSKPLPVDSLFTALAEEKKQQSVGIILSGTGIDGAAGIQAIKRAGGISIVQDPQTARHPQMPLEAMGSRQVDLVLPPDKIWQAVHQHVLTPAEQASRRANVYNPPTRAADHQHLASATIADQLQFQATILENVRNSVIVTDLDGMIIYWNAGAEEIFGYTRQEMLHRPIQLLHKEFDSHAFIQRHLSGRNPAATGIDWLGTHKSGYPVWVNVKTNPLYNQQGEITGIIGVAVDITAKKLAEEELRSTQISLRAMLDTAPNAHFLLAKDYSIISFNKVAADYIQRIWHTAVAVGDSMLKYSTTATMESFEINFNRCLQGEKIHFEKRIDYPEGRKIWYEILYVPLTGSDGSVVAVSFSGLDITRRKKAEKRLKRSNKALANFKYAITSASIVSVTDAAGVITYVNENFIRISQYREEELLGQTHRIINSGYHRPEFFRHLWKTISQGKIWRGEVKNRARDGSYYWVDTFIIPFLNKKGKPVQYLSIRNDITNRKNTEEVLIRQNTELEKTNAELDKFVYSASHNLRAPLTSIMGLINLIQQGEDPLFYLNMIERSVKRLDEFIKDIVNYSKNSRLYVTVEKIDLAAMLQVVIEDLRFMKDVDKIEIQVEVQGDYPFYSDAQRLKVVFSNLLSNAFKYHNYQQPHPFVYVHISYRETCTTVRVEDNGLGISAEHHPKLFNMFYRATSASEGSGLGLYIVKEVIEKLRGTIAFNSAPNKGTTFELALPSLQPAQ